LEQSKRKKKDRLEVCSVCNTPLNPSKRKTVFDVLNNELGWFCKKCHTMYDNENKIIELGNFESDEIGIA
jgi:uncharacterized protein with PIN domain